MFIVAGCGRKERILGRVLLLIGPCCAMHACQIQAGEVPLTFTGSTLCIEVLDLQSRVIFAQD